jgi:hypothetical protein
VGVFGVVVVVGVGGGGDVCVVLEISVFVSVDGVDVGDVIWVDMGVVMVVLSVVYVVLL